MNAYELAEITAVLAKRALSNKLRIQQLHIRSGSVLSRRGLAGQLHIRSSNDPALSCTIIYNGSDRLATIYEHADGSWRAINADFDDYQGDTRAQALANLLDSTA